MPTIRSLRAVVKTDVSDACLQDVIDEAYLLVGDCIVGLEDARKTAIVRWTAAHILYSTSRLTNMRELRITSRKLGDASETYASGPTGEGLRSSIYGQRAIDLDPSGCLAGLGQPGKRRAGWCVL